MQSLLTRRDTIRGIGLAGLAAILPATSRAQSSDTTCVLTPEQTEGPYYFDADLLRSDITGGNAGTALRLAVNVVDATTCSPVQNAIVDVWHADASGTYSGYAGEGTAGQTFCRGIQVSDADGAVAFTTVYPGWYNGRTTHIHVKVHVGATTALTSQLYFPDDVSDTVYAQGTYASRGTRTTTNENDAILGGVDDEDAVLLDVTLENGVYVGEVTIGIETDGTTTTTTPGGSTTTTLPSGACAGTTFAAAHCRTTALRASVEDALPDEGLRRRLLRIVDHQVDPRITRAEALATDGSTRRGLRQLGRALGGVTAFRAALQSRSGRSGADDATRTTLDASAQTLATTLRALRTTLQ